MSTWVTHLMVADEVIKKIPYLSRHEFFVGNIAPDCNVENEDWTEFTPSRKVTHWMGSERKNASDCERFLHEFLESKEGMDVKEESFWLGYYAHLITDAEIQRYTREEERVKASWDRIKRHPVLSESAKGMEETWDSVKILIAHKERQKDIYALEAVYLEKHPDTGYLTDIITLEEFPDYVDYLPKGAIARKVRVMGDLPVKEEGKYPYIGMSKEEYRFFIQRATALVVEAIEGYKKAKKA